MRGVRNYFGGSSKGDFHPYVEQGARFMDHGHGDFSIRRGHIV
jgi:hypothetical protein